MAESTLALKKSDLQTKTALFLGWGRGSDNGDRAWTDTETAYLKEFVDSACRQFYFPILDDGNGYEWSFLKPVASLTLAADENTVALPADFGGADGRITVAVTDSSISRVLDFSPVGMVYGRQAELPSATGWPDLACIEPIKGVGPLRSQREQLRIWPIADQDYTLQFQYRLIPEALTDAYPYAYGGPVHAETLLEGALAIAELRLDDLAEGPHKAAFRERLMASVAIDRTKKPSNLGYNGDRSDQKYCEVYGRPWRWPSVSSLGGLIPD